MSNKTRKPEDMLWYVHAPLKNEKRPVVEAPPPSNIPYLNGVMDTDEEINKQTVIYFKDTDSEFVKLSKLGGREDLLIHKMKERTKEPVGYPRPGWWTDMLEVSSGEKTEKAPYVFEVPAWFAHTTKVNPKEIANKPLNFPYATESSQPFSYKTNKYEPIEEPKKYGELRNYLNPVKIKTQASNKNISNKPTLNNGSSLSNSSERSNEAPKLKKSATTMPKLISNFYSKERPMNYESWKEQNSNSVKSIVASSRSK